MASDFADERKNLLQEIKYPIRQAAWDQYTQVPFGGGRKLAPAFSGRWIYGLKMYPSTNKLTVRNEAPYAGWIEEGRPPGPIPQETLLDWTENKLGWKRNSRTKRFRRLWWKILKSGYPGAHIMHNALSPNGVGAGPGLHAEIQRIYSEWFNNLGRKHGLR